MPLGICVELAGGGWGETTALVAKQESAGVDAGGKERSERARKHGRPVHGTLGSADLHLKYSNGKPQQVLQIF